MWEWKVMIGVWSIVERGHRISIVKYGEVLWKCTWHCVDVPQWWMNGEVGVKVLRQSEWVIQVVDQSECSRSSNSNTRTVSRWRRPRARDTSMQLHWKRQLAVGGNCLFSLAALCIDFGTSEGGRVCDKARGPKWVCVVLPVFLG